MENVSPEMLMGALVVVVAFLAVTAVALWRRRRRVEPAIEAPPAEAALPAPAATTLSSSALAPVAGRTSFFTGLARTRERLSGSLRRLFGGGAEPALLEALEEDLISADVGVRTAAELVQAIRNQPGADPRSILAAELRRRMGAGGGLVPPTAHPHVILVVGVNGSGKTTTIGKLAARYRAEGKTVVLGAGDTFRAGAIEQLKVWGERSGAHVVAQQEGSDPAAVIFDAVQATRARNADILICDTAGRLQSQKPLMDELGKVVRILKKALPDAPHEVLLVLDATIGQNALSQARIFKEVVGVTGIVLTKVDGTAKGGVVVAVTEELGLPVKLLGLGEKVQDLCDFEPGLFVDGLLGIAESGDDAQASA